MRFITYFSTSSTPPGMVMTGYSAAAEDDINDGRKEKKKKKLTELSRRRNPEARSYKNSGQCFNLSPLSCGSNPFCRTQANQPDQLPEHPQNHHLTTAYNIMATVHYHHCNKPPPLYSYRNS